MAEDKRLSGEGRISIEVDAKELEHLIDLVAGADRGTKEYAATLDRLEKGLVSASGALKSLSTAGNGNLAVIKQQEKAYRTYAENIRVAAQASKDVVTSQNLAFSTYSENMPAALKRTQDAVFATYQENVRYSQQQEQFYNTLPRARYALYDVARTYTAVSAATLGAATAVGAVGMSFETSFAQVERTTGVTGAAVGQLRRDLEDLTTSIPESFGQISEIAALGGQLGIAADGIDEFTEVTAKLTATTDLSAEAAGTALGRFQALLGVPSSEFENLASSILKVGVNSVATETQIVQIATQISSMGKFAGLTADQVVGLAGALASTGTQPELARGTVTRLFTLMSKAVGEAGAQLDEFARVSGVSAEEFQRAWGTSEFSDILQKFLRGLNAEGKAAIETLSALPKETIESAESFDDLGLAGTNVVETLNALGITSVRDVPALLRLAGASKVVGDSFSDAASGFADATELNEQYAIIAETLAAKLSTLGNTFKAIMANIADPETLSVLGGILSAVQKVAEVFLAISRNPIGKAVLGVVAAFTALLGVFAAVRATQMLVSASAAGLITAQRELAAASGVTSLSLKELTRQMILTGTAGNTAAVGTRTFSTALKGLLITTGVGIALAALAGAVELFMSRADRAANRVTNLIGSVTSLTDAMREDGKIFVETGEGVELFSDKVDFSANAAENAAPSVQKWATEMQNAADGVADTAAQLDEVPAKIDEVTLAFGRNTQALIANTLAGNENFVKIWTQYGPAIEAAGYSLSDFITALGSEDGGLAFLKKALSDVSVEVATLRAGFAGFEGIYDDALTAKFESLQDAERGMKQLLDTMGTLDDGIAAAVTEAAILEAGMEGLADKTETAEEQAARLADEQKQLAQDMLDAANATWAQVEATIALENSLYGLGASIAENGLDFSTTTEAGRANLSSLGQVINILTAQAGEDTAMLANNIAGLMEALSAMGVNVAQDLAFLGQMVADLGGATGLGAVTDAAGLAIRALDQGFGSVVPKAANRARDAVEEVEKAVRTTADYASDLSSVIADAFRFRFGEQNAKDKTKQLWQDMKDQIKDAKNRAKELRLEIQAIRAAQASLQSRKAVLLYQLGVARDYGDTLREQQILAELGEIESDLADNKKDLKDKTKELKGVQDELKLSLEGNTDAARKQRKAVQELLESYADQLEEAARNGASQKELKELAKKLKDEFEKQAKKIGLSKDELEKYSGAFDDMVEIVDDVPRDVTTKWKADASPAEKALANFKAKMDRERKKIEKPFSVSAKFKSNVDSNLTGLKAAQQSLAEALKAQAKAYKDQPGGGTQVDYWDKKVNYWRKILGAYKGYASGGFTGRGGTYEAAGTVHRGEFVFPKHMVNQNTGLPYANVLGSMAHAMGAMSSGSGQGNGIQLVELLPTQLHELARIVSTTLTVDGAVLGRAANGYNSAQYNRGAG